ncbi:hypothetical protein NDU88_002146 [Pleurodeles waltl]|uniref:Uncharacterized protein n=1 Tax=Pleurodeles waltl TaxID=8319 RepID=A0AAV7LBS3_PLEWA|nr:hypothetical protein NDU88_002146 [Pleurodeles waltl]
MQRTAGPPVLYGGSPRGAGGPEHREAPQDLPNWVPPVFRRAGRRAEGTRLRPPCRPFSFETRCQPAGSRRLVVGVRVGNSAVVEGFRRGLRCFFGLHGPPPSPQDRYSAELGV